YGSLYKIPSEVYPHRDPDVSSPEVNQSHEYTCQENIHKPHPSIRRIQEMYERKKQGGNKYRNQRTVPIHKYIQKVSPIHDFFHKSHHQIYRKPYEQIVACKPLIYLDHAHRTCKQEQDEG